MSWLAAVVAVLAVGYVLANWVRTRMAELRDEIEHYDEMNPKPRGGNP